MKKPKRKNFFGHSKKEFRELYLNNTAAEISKKLGIPKSTISSWAKRAGITKPKLKTNAPIWPPNQKNYLLKYYLNGKTAQEIADRFGRSRFAVINKYRELKGMRDKFKK